MPETRSRRETAGTSEIRRPRDPLGKPRGTRCSRSPSSAPKARLNPGAVTMLRSRRLLAGDVLANRVQLRRLGAYIPPPTHTSSGET